MAWDRGALLARSYHASKRLRSRADKLRGPGFNRVVNGRIDKASFEVQVPTSTTYSYSYSYSYSDVDANSYSHSYA
jgi:hypothetical protein